MKIKILTAVLTVILSLATYASADVTEAVPNDVFDNAVTLVLNEGAVAVNTNNASASKETGEPNHAGNAGGRSVWFNFTPQTTMNVRISTMNTNFDTLLAVYTGASVDSLTHVGSNDNCSSVCGGASALDLMLTGGQTYRIAVDGAGAASGNFRLAILGLDAPLQDNFDSPYNLGTNYLGSIAGTNYNATSETGEPIHYGGAPANKSVWYRWTPGNESYSVAIEISDNYHSVISVKSATVPNPTFAQLSSVNYGTQSHGFTLDKYKMRFFAEAGKTYYFSVDGRADAADNSGNFQMKIERNRIKYSLQQSSTERAAIAVYRPGNNIWYLKPSFSPVDYVNFGLAGDKPVPADYYGRGFCNIAVTRNENGKKFWYIKEYTFSTSYKFVQWGLDSDKPVYGDFDRDGVADIAVTRQTPEGLVWYIRRSGDASMLAFRWGLNTDKPVSGDFDGDGMTDAAITRSENGSLTWYILKSGFGTGAPAYTQSEVKYFGLSGDLPAVEDFDGDGKSDIAVFRPSSGVWYILRSSTGEMQATPFGVNNDRPQPADYNGDGKADLAVFRPSEGTWYIAKPIGVPAQNFDLIYWGTAGDTPLMAVSQIMQ